MIGGPPCQGFSRANVTSLSSDPRNKLPKLYLDIVKALQRLYTVEFIVFENVPGIRDKKHEKTYHALIKGIEALGFDVTEKELCSADFGVPQNRRRVVLSGMRKQQCYSQVKPRKRNGLATARQAIGGLKDQPTSSVGWSRRTYRCIRTIGRCSPSLRDSRCRGPRLPNSAASRGWTGIRRAARSPSVTVRSMCIPMGIAGSASTRHCCCKDSQRRLSWRATCRNR